MTQTIREATVDDTKSMKQTIRGRQSMTQTMPMGRQSTLSEGDSR